MQRSKNYHREQARKHQKKHLQQIKNIYRNTDWIDERFIGKLKTGKGHCNCSICRDNIQSKTMALEKRAKFHYKKEVEEFAT